MKRFVFAVIMFSLLAQGVGVEGQTVSDGQNSESDTDFTITPVNVQNSEAFQMVVIGDSIAWGTGLRTEEKYSYLVGQWIAEQLNRPVHVKVLAHTGATIDKSSVSSDSISYPVYYPELANSTPTLMEQADRIQDPNNIKLILVSGGANDVGLDNILMLDYGLGNLLGWGSSVNDIRKAAEEIEPSMLSLLNKLLHKCPNARVVVTGYYTGISNESKGISEAVNVMRPESQKLPGYKKLDDDNKGQIVKKSNLFYQISNERLSEAINVTNKNIRVARNVHIDYDRVAFVRIFFPPERCYGTDQSWLWKIVDDPITKQKITNDNMFNYRKTILMNFGWYCQCELCISDPTTLTEATSIQNDVDIEKLCDKYRRNKLVAIGHPNVDGAKNYTESIIHAIGATWPTWLHPTVLSFDVSPLNVISGESFSIDYTVSDNDGSGLSQVELWRKNETSDWQEIKRNSLTGESGPLSGSFTDSPYTPGTYWYGVHVVDNAGNWNDESNSNTNYQPASFEPIEVEVVYSGDGLLGISGTLIRSLEGHCDHPQGLSIIDVAFSPDGRTLASLCSFGGLNPQTRIDLWEVLTGSLISTFEGNMYSNVIFSPDGNILASIGKDKVELWNVSTGTVIQTLKSSVRVHDIAFSPDGRMLAASGKWDSIILWDVSTGDEILKLNGHSPYTCLTSVAFSPDGEILAAGGDFSMFGGYIQLWDVSTGTEIRTVESDPRWVSSLAFSPDGSVIASGGYKSNVKLSDVSTGITILTLDFSTGSGGVESVAFSPDGRILAAASRYGGIKLWDVVTGEMQTLTNEWQLSSLAFSPDGNMLASGGGSGIVRVWRLT